MSLAYAHYENVNKKCENCAFWEPKYQTHIPTGLPGLFGPEVTQSCLCLARSDGPEVESDPLLAKVHTGLAMVFTAATASCGNWKPDEETRREVEAAEEEYERALVWHHQRGQYPGINCPPL